MTTVHAASDLIYLSGFADYQTHRNFSPATIRCRHAVLSAFVRHMEPRSVLSAAPVDVERWLSSRRLGAQGRYTYLAHLHAFYRWANRRGLTGSDPTTNIDRPKLPKRLPRPITPPELDVALAEAGPQMRAWLYLGSFAGLRRAEIASLDRADVLDHLTPPMLAVRNGKGAKDRNVPLHPAVLDALAAHGLPRSGPVFRTPAGAPVTPAYVGDVVARFLRGVGVDRTLHSTRHAFGSAVYAVCHDLLMVRDLMGHANAASSEGYVAFDGGEAAVVVGRLGSPPPPPSSRRARASPPVGRDALGPAISCPSVRRSVRRPVRKSEHAQRRRQRRQQAEPLHGVDAIAGSGGDAPRADAAEDGDDGLDVGGESGWVHVGHS